MKFVKIDLLVNNIIFEEEIVMRHVIARKAIPLLLAMTTILLAACGTGSTSTTSQPSNTSAVSTDATSADPSSTAAAEQEPVTLTCFLNQTWYWTDKFEGIIPEAITAKTGVKLETTRAVDDKQLGLMIASGDLPDLIWTSSDLDRLSDENLSYSYTDLMAQYTPDWEVDKLRQTNAASYSKDGKIYFILNNFNTAEEWNQYPGTPMLPTLAFRSDIMAELGNPKMDTLDDYVKILGMVKEKYPDKIPLATSTDAGWRMMFFRCMMGIGNSNFIENTDGSVIYFVDHPKYKDYCAFVNNLYRKGYINADNFSLSDADTKPLFQNAKSFSFSGYTQGEMYRYGQMAQAVEPSATVMESKPLGSDGVYYSSGIGWSGLVITKKCPYPDKAIEMMQYLFTDEGQKLGEWGREGTEFTMGDDGYPKFSDEWLEAAASDKTLYGKYNPAFFFGTSGAVEATGRIAVLPEDYRAVYSTFKPLMQTCPWISYAEPKGDSDENTIYAKMKDLTYNNEVKVFLSATDEEFNKNFDEYMANAKQIGVEELEAYMTENVAKAKLLYE